MDRRSFLGFTILETALFIGLSGLLLVALTVNSTRGVAIKRYEDSVDGMASFLKDVYSSVLNPKNENSTIDTSSNGRISCTMKTDSAGIYDVSSYTYNSMTSGTTKCAFYGKIVVFGSNTRSNDIPETTIYALDVIGDAVDHDNESDYSRLFSTSSVLEELEIVHADYRATTGTPPKCILAGSEMKYSTSWDAKLIEAGGNDYEAIVLIVRSPKDGRVYTYINNSTRNLFNSTTNEYECSNQMQFYDFIYSTSSFSQQDSSFCVYIDGPGTSNYYHMITILSNGQNPSAIKVDKTDTTGRAVCS